MDLAVRGIAELARPAALAMEPYVWEAANHEIAARYGLQPRDVVRYDTNTSPLPPPTLGAVLARVAIEPAVHEYFDGSYAALSQALAAYTGYAASHLVIGAGADEILDVLAKTFIDPGDVVVIPSPTYALYRIVAQTMGANIRALPAQPDLAFDLDALADAAHGAKAIFLCNPNNPTGSAVPTAAIERLVRRVACLVIVDEAYAEFSGESLLPLVRREPRLIVVRTLSKAFSLAGARIGYAICGEEAADLANRMRPPNSISYVSALLGEAALGDLAAMRATVTLLLAQRRALADALGAMGHEVLPSVANFVLARWPSPEAAARAHQACLSRGMVLRSYPDHPLLGSYLRITARTPEQTSRLIETLRSL
jgi:histidinol-phosphate aminotransferase